MSSEAAWKAHVDAWHPSRLTLAALEGAQRTWPYRPDLHVLIEAPDGILAATAIMWLDELNKTAEFEQVGTHRDYRRLGLGQALLLHGIGLAKRGRRAHDGRMPGRQGPPRREGPVLQRGLPPVHPRRPAQKTSGLTLPGTHRRHRRPAG